VYQTNILSFGGPETPGAFLAGSVPPHIAPSWFRDVVDPRMAYIADHGLLNALALGWYAAIDGGADTMVRFAQYIVAQYSTYAMIWTLAGEVAGYDPRLRQARLDCWREVAVAIREADAYGHPLTAHLTAERPIPNDDQGETWLTLTLNQHGHGDMDLGTTHYRDHIAAHPGVPLVEGESLYEGLTTVEKSGRRTVTDTMVRQAAWRAIQSGCCGYTYGAQGCCNGAWDTQDMATTWGSLPWYDGIDLPGANQMGHLGRFYASRDWPALRPAPGCSRRPRHHGRGGRPSRGPRAQRPIIEVHAAAVTHHAVGLGSVGPTGASLRGSVARNVSPLAAPSQAPRSRAAASRDARRIPRAPDP